MEDGKKGDSMYRLARCAVIAGVCVLAGLPALASTRLVVVEEPFWSVTKDAVEAIEAYGGRVRIVVLPNFIIADVPDKAEADLLTTGSISGILSGELDPDGFTRYGGEARHIITAWNNVYMGKSREMGLDEEPPADRRPLVDDIVPVFEPGLLSKPPGAKIYDTSEFMLGSVALGVILPESDGSIDPSSEDWTQAEQDNVTSEIIAASAGLLSGSTTRQKMPGMLRPSISAASSSSFGICKNACLRRKILKAFTTNGRMSP